MAAERAKVTQAMALLREAREGVDGYGAWAQSDALHGVINDVEAQVTALLDLAVAPQLAEDRVESDIAAEEERIAADPDIPSGF